MGILRFGRCAPAAIAVVLLAVGCGTQTSADLFSVKRSGSLPGAKLKLLVNDSGTVSCNGGPPRALPDNLLLDARELARDLAADKDKPIPAIGVVSPTYTFNVTLGAGTISWPVGVPVPDSFNRLVYFTRKVAKGVCGLPR